MRWKLLARCVAEKSASLVELHKARTILKLSWQNRKQLPKEPVCQLGAVNDDAMSIASTRNQLLFATANVEQCCCEALFIYPGDQCSTILFTKDISSHTSEAVRACARTLRSHGQFFYFNPWLSRFLFVNKIGSYPWQASAIWIFLGCECLIFLPICPITPWWRQWFSCKGRHASCNALSLFICRRGNR